MSSGQFHFMNLKVSLSHCARIFSIAHIVNLLRQSLVFFGFVLGSDFTFTSIHFLLRLWLRMRLQKMS